MEGSVPELVSQVDVNFFVGCGFFEGLLPLVDGSGMEDVLHG